MAFNAQRSAETAPAVTRIGLSLVILWFGTSQLLDASGWTVWLPDWVSVLPVSGETLVRMNGAFEVLFGILLLLGLYTRIAALLLALHMFHLVLTVGYSAIGVRDFGLAMAMAAVFLYGPDRYTLDRCLERGAARLAARGSTKVADTE